MSPLNKTLRLAAASAATLLAAGCTLGPDFARPDTPQADSYAMKGDPAPGTAEVKIAPTAPGEPWWGKLGSPSLDRTIRQALTDSPTIAEADATLGQAMASLAETRGGEYPQVTANAGFNRERVNLNAFGFSGFGGIALANPTFSLYSLGGAVSYDLDLFGKTRRMVESAAARTEAAGWRANAAYLTLSANVALQAVTIATLKAEIKAVEEMVAADQHTVDLITKATQFGGSTTKDSTAAKSQLERDRAELPQLQGQLVTARHALAQLVGHAPAEWTPPDFSLEELAATAAVPISLPSALVRQRPDILAAEADVHAATADIGVATANMYPDLNLTASLTQGSLGTGKLFSYDSSAWDLGAGLTAPIFDGGRLSAEKDRAVQAAKAADARYRQTVITAFTQVADALAALKADDDTIQIEMRAEAEARENARLSDLAFREGGGTLIDQLDAQRQHNDAIQTLVRAKGQRLADLIRLSVAAGGTWQSATQEASVAPAP